MFHQLLIQEWETADMGWSSLDDLALKHLDQLLDIPKSICCESMYLAQQTFTWFFFHMRTKVRIIRGEKVPVFKKSKAIGWVEEKTVTKVKKKKILQDMVAAGIPLCRSFILVSMSCLLFLMSSAHFRLMPWTNNRKNTERRAQAHGLGRPYYVTLLSFCITRSKGSKQLWTNRNILQQQIW